MSISFVLKAVDFAARRHVDQFRKGEEKVPYVSHPICVARVLSDVIGVADSEVLAAAVLHDVLEDTVRTRAEYDDLRLELTREFGERVAEIVEELTDDKWLEKAERKRLQIEHAPDLSIAAATVKLADKLCNVRDVSQSPPTNWSIERRMEYIAHAEAVVRRLPGGVPTQGVELFLAEAEAARMRVAPTDGIVEGR